MLFGFGSEAFHLCSFVSHPECAVCVCVFLNATSLGEMALYYPDRRTLASYCADHGKTPSSVESLLINVPFSLITPQLVEAAGCASFPSCSYEDSLSALITRSVKVSERPRATCEPRSFEVTNNENKEQTSFSRWVINRIRMSRGHESKVMRPDCVRKDLYTFSNLHWTIKICSRVSLSHCVCLVSKDHYSISQRGQ